MISHANGNAIAGSSSTIKGRCQSCALPGAPRLLLHRYTVERLLHGWEASYNDVPDWEYGTLFKAFAPEVKDAKTFKVNTAAEMDKLLSDQEFSSATYPQVSYDHFILDTEC